MPSPSLKSGKLEPMYASVGTGIPTGNDWAFEPKYDGVRVLAYGAPGAAAALVTRNGRDKARQFPEVAAAIRALAEKRRRPLVLDGEIVALAGRDVARFQALQSRLHVQDEDVVALLARESPATLIAFDLLADGDEILLREPWTVRRAALIRAVGRRTRHLRTGASRRGSGPALLRDARRLGWEGIIAKRTAAPYRPGIRSDDWRKLKVEFRQEFVVGGWTEPRRSRPSFGALLLGHYEHRELVYAGHTGSGFTHDGLREMHARLARLERATSPFSEPPRTNERAHWVRPEIVVEVKFTEWTADGRLRHPIFVGVRDDKPARAVRREKTSVQRTKEGRGL